MFFIALTGGIASGKSTISQRLKDHGATVLDADQLARVVVSPGWPALDAIVREFGASVLSADGALNREALAQIVFSDPEKLARLNAIVHPAIQTHVAQVISEFGQEHPAGVLVYEIPLLVESEHTYEFDLIVVAEAPEKERIARMVELRGMTEDDARARLANQASNADRRKIADVVIDTSGDLSETLQQTDELWERISTLASAHAVSVGTETKLGK